MENTDTHSRA